ncbi:hypothetical protein ACIBQ1_59120 [Nonomuraea sp. NPDC050153]|uniref:hypothetical protein n=1 Tax=Nonomuraea sp. NPDC050153 TaxID=3364359 RepID=UPI0037B3FEE7
MRKLHAGGREFVWKGELHHVSGGRDCHRCVRLRVWGAGKNSRVLQADLLSTAVLPWGCASDGSYPTPGDVRKVVDHALTRGWDPDAAGGVFFLGEEEHAAGFELTGFLLTERLRDESAPDPTARVLAVFERTRSCEGGGS